MDVEQKDRFLHFLHQYLDLDFTNYSEASVRRRIVKVLKELRLSDVDSYIDHLKQDSNARETFLEKFTVNVTEMFRDPYCYEALVKRVFPSIKDLGKIKIWSAGCSSGEEVVSLCILLKEHGLLDQSHIIATDLSTSILHKAKKARYPLRLGESYSRSYQDAGGKGNLSDYYRVHGEEIAFDPDLLRHVDFLALDILKSPPEDGFDLIVCRNVLIYFNALLQDQVLGQFDNTLKPKGYLMTGSKESLIFYGHNHHFQEIDRDCRIYQKKG